MVVWPFKTESVQRAFSFIVGMLGLLLVSLGIANPTTAFSLSAFNVSHSGLGLF